MRIRRATFVFRVILALPLPVYGVDAARAAIDFLAG